MNDVEAINYLMIGLDKGEYSIESFCREFVQLFRNLNADLKKSMNNNDALEDLFFKVARYTPFEEDLKKYPNVYYSEEEIRLAVKTALSDIGSKRSY